MTRVLLSEDEPILARNIQSILERSGIEVTHASSANETRSALRMDQFEIVVADISLGDGDALSVLDSESDSVGNTPVIVMTGQDSESNRARAGQLPASAFLVKPFALTQLRDLVESLTKHAANTQDGPETPPGAASSPEVTDGFKLRFVPGFGRHTLPCWLAVPDRHDPSTHPVVTVHGIRRGAKQHAAEFGTEAATSGRLVIAPLYKQTDWPSYQQVVRKGRADLALLGLLQALRAQGLVGTEKFALAGFSGGAQFAHRFAMLYPHLIHTLSLTAAGWYTFPDDAAFPYGFGPMRRGHRDWGAKMAARLHEFLQIPINISVGSLDCYADENTRRGENIDLQQGDNRLERAKCWSAALADAAQSKGLRAPNVRFEVLPDANHDFATCVRKGGLMRTLRPSFFETNRDGSNAVPTPEII